jgi:hypothetical protein
MRQRQRNRYPHPQYRPALRPSNPYHALPQAQDLHTCVSVSRLRQVSFGLPLSYPH